MRRLSGATDNYFVKILIMLLVFAMVPLTSSGVISYGIARISMVESAMSRSEADVRQVREGIEAMLQQHFNSLDILCKDEDINNLLIHKRSEDYYKANYKLALIVGGGSRQLAAHVVSSDSHISATTASVPREYQYLYQSGWGIFRKADAYSLAVVHVNDTNLRSETGAVLSIARAVRDDYNHVLGYIIIDLGRENLTALLPERGDSNLYIINDHDFVMFSSRGVSGEGQNRLSHDLAIAAGGCPEGRGMVEQNGEKLAIVTASIPDYELTIISELSLDVVTRDTRTIRNANLAVILLMIVFCPLAAVLAAKNTSAPIRKMTRLMKQVEAGDFTVRTGFTKKDEIGVMGRTFDHMTEQIKALIEKVEAEQRSLSIAQMQALQAQINPHFLYNTLDLIKYKALLGENEDVVDITIQLGRMLRYLASVKEDFVEVSFELEFIYQYLDIQKRRYGERFQLVTDIDAEIMSEPIPKLILQPAVENAVIHGLEKRLDGGELLIAGHRDGKYIVFTITDNGSGIAPERLKQLQQEQTSGAGRIGLNNVHIRARLYGDHHCGIDLQSEMGIGTKITITIQAVKRGDTV